tara:strand:+ start:47 stop:982 length:936 start_codon:yes stop_codon:yes gene_type:complete
MHIINFFIPIFITFFILKITIPYFKIYIPAIPTNRGMHRIIKPTGGGISFVLIYITFAIFRGFYLPLISFPLALIGLLDDKLNISSKAKFVAQTLTVFAIIIFLKNNQVTFLNTFLENNFLYYLIFSLIGISIINFINFMDGIDGLVCGSFIVLLFILNPSKNEFYPLIGALLGFSKLNWYSSKIFMGDAGSLFLGSFIVSILFKSNNSVDFIKILLLMTPLIIDPFITIIRRIATSQRIFSAHKLHLYQRLVSNGLSHSQVSLIYILSIFFLGIFYKFSSVIYLSIASLLIILLGVFLDKKFALRFHQKN